MNKALSDAQKSMEEKNKAKAQLDELTQEVNVLRGKDAKMC